MSHMRETQCFRHDTTTITGGEQSEFHEDQPCDNTLAILCFLPDC